MSRHSARVSLDPRNSTMAPNRRESMTNYRDSNYTKRWEFPKLHYRESTSAPKCRVSTMSRYSILRRVESRRTMYLSRSLDLDHVPVFPVFRERTTNSPFRPHSHCNYSLTLTMFQCHRFQYRSIEMEYHPLDSIPHRSLNSPIDCRRFFQPHNFVWENFDRLCRD